VAFNKRKVFIAEGDLHVRLVSIGDMKAREFVSWPKDKAFRLIYLNERVGDQCLCSSNLIKDLPHEKISTVCLRVH
jgi:hypothetical protein